MYTERTTAVFIYISQTGMCLIRQLEPQQKWKKKTDILKIFLIIIAKNKRFIKNDNKLILCSCYARCKCVYIWQDKRFTIFVAH